jgi:hypothetical protein
VVWAEAEEIATSELAAMARRGRRVDFVFMERGRMVLKSKVLKSMGEKWGYFHRKAWPAKKRK